LVGSRATEGKWRSCDGALLHDTGHCMHCESVCYDSAGHEEPVFAMSRAPSHTGECWARHVSGI
jgi:hypothetical protein